MKIYIDMDGVLSDFELGYKLKFPDSNILDKTELDANKTKFAEMKFFEELPIIEEGISILQDLVNNGFDVEILTSVGDNDLIENIRQKRIWIKTHIPFDIKFNWVKKAHQKALFANENTLLIDDRDKSIIPFERAGGKCIKFNRKDIMLTYEEFKERELNEKLITFGNIAYPKFNNVVILAGGAGSGKGFVLSKLIGIEGWKFDVDKLKELSILSSKFSQTVKDKTGIDLKSLNLKDPDNTSVIHEILSDIFNIDKKYQNTQFKSILLADENRKPNLIFDVTLKDISKLESITRNVKSLGYPVENIHIVWVVNDILVALKQNSERKRQVNPEILINTHDGSKLTMFSILDMGERLKKYMDGDIVIVFNNASIDSSVNYSEFGGNYIEKSNYAYIKHKGKKQLSRKELPNDIYDKIKQYTPDFGNID